MEVITNEQKKAFAEKEFPGQPVNYGNGDWWYIQAGTMLGEWLHYEYWGGRLNLHIEGPDWRQIRDYLWKKVDDKRLISSKWHRNGCCWTLQKELSNWEDVKTAFIEIDKILGPHIREFEILNGYQAPTTKSITTDSRVYAHEISIQKCLEQPLVIPIYQRPYVWTISNVEQMLNDIYANYSLNSSSRYMIGSVILHKDNDMDGNLKLNIVDGQQRITTMFMILKVLDFEMQCDGLIYTHADSLDHIKENFSYIQMWIKDHGSEAFREYITKNCLFVQIEVQDQQEAFQMFETQNGRGKALKPYNLLKAYHIRAMSAEKESLRIECDKRWESAADFSDQQNRTIDLLEEVLSYHLYRGRRLYAGHSVGEFTKKDIGEFKGFTLNPKDIHYPIENALIAGTLTNDLVKMYQLGIINFKSRFTKVSPDNISPFIHIDDKIINGLFFFDYVESFIEIYKHMFVSPFSEQDMPEFNRFYNKACRGYNGWDRRKGDRFVRKSFEILCMALIDRFGEEILMEYCKDIFTYLYWVRLKNTNIIENKNKDILEKSMSILKIIRDANCIASLAAIKYEGTQAYQNLLDQEADLIKEWEEGSRPQSWKTDILNTIKDYYNGNR